MIVHSPHIIVSGEAILSAENSGNPLGSRDSAPNPDGELTALPRPHSWWGRAAVPSAGIPPSLSAVPSVVTPNEKAWTRPALLTTKSRIAEERMCESITVLLTAKVKVIHAGR